MRQAFLATAIFLGALLQARQVLGHGYVGEVIIAGKSFPGNSPAEGGQGGPSAVRQIYSTSPVKGVNNPDLACGSGATAATLVADAHPGDTIAFRWFGAGKSSWPHRVGPILTYMASCGSVSCDKFNPANAQWFKVSELAKKPNGDWYMADVQAGVAMEVKIPSTLKGGNYLIRHEIIALHVAATLGGAEFYPSCTQLRVDGSQAGTPAQSDLVRFPGAYQENHPGIFTPDIYDQGLKYVVPGPPIANIAGGNGEGAAPEPAPSSTTDQASSSSTSDSSISSSPTSAESTTSADFTTSAVPTTPAELTTSAEPTSSGSSSSTSDDPYATPTDTPRSPRGNRPAPVANAGSKPAPSPASPPATARSPAITKVCHKRSRRSLGCTEEEAAKRSAPSEAPLQSHARHSRRGMRRLDHGSF